MFNTVEKIGLVNESILFSIYDESLPEKLLSHLAHNWINIVSLDGNDDPIAPTAGEYNVYVKTSPNTGFELVQQPLDADKTGGSSMPDGVERGVYYSSIVEEIKITPVSVTGAVSYQVHVRQVDEGTLPLLQGSSTIKVDDTGRPLTAFGESSVAEPTPVIQISAQYGLTDEVMSILENGGTSYNGDSLFNVSSGTDPLGLASLNTSKQLAYKPGQGALARFTALFTTAVPDSLQVAGLINSEDAFAFGYSGEDFGIIYSRKGVTEHQELTVTNASGNETASVTVNGIAYSVPLTTGGINHNAQEIAASLTSQVPNFLFTANNNVVSSMDILPRPNSTYAFTSATAVATWEQQQAGLEPEVSLIQQATWNRDKVSWLDPTKGNVYSVSIQYLGFGNIQFSVEDETTGLPTLVHQLEYANKNTKPSVSNPTFRIGWLARNLGNTSDLVVSGASAAGFIEGKNIIDSIPRAVESVTTGIGMTQTNIITIRNRFHFGDKINRADIIPLLVSMGTESIKGAFFRLVANAEFAGDINFSYNDEVNSIAETSTDQVELVPDTGRFIASFLVTQQGLLLSSSDFKTRIFPDDQLTLSSAVTANPAAVMTASAVWQEET